MESIECVSRGRDDDGRGEAERDEEGNCEKVAVGKRHAAAARAAAAFGAVACAISLGTWSTRCSHSIHDQYVTKHIAFKTVQSNYTKAWQSKATARSEQWGVTFRHIL